MILVSMPLCCGDEIAHSASEIVVDDASLSENDRSWGSSVGEAGFTLWAFFGEYFIKYLLNVGFDGDTAGDGL